MRAEGEKSFERGPLKEVVGGGPGERFEFSKKAVEEAVSLILTPAQFAKLPEEDRRSTKPYTLSAGGRSLLFVPADHTDDKNNPLFERISSSMDEFAPTLVLIEGWRDMAPEVPEETRSGRYSEFKNKIPRGNRSMGESAFTFREAAEREIEVISPEIVTEREEVDYLLKLGFKQREIFAFFGARDLEGIIRSSLPFDLHTELSKALADFKKTTNWNGFDYSIAHFNSLLWEFVGRGIDADQDFWNFAVAPKTPEEEPRATVINRISAASSMSRDRNIVRYMAERLGKPERILVVYGQHHAIVQKPALQRLFGHLKSLEE